MFTYLTWQPHTPGIIPILHMSLNLKIRHKEPVHNWKSSIRLFPLDLYLHVILRYFRPLQDVNFAINLTQAKKFIGTFITYFTVIQSKNLHFPHINIPQVHLRKKVWISLQNSFFGRGNSFSPYISTSNVCPLAIPEFFAHNMDIRLLASLLSPKWPHYVLTKASVS